MAPSSPRAIASILFPPRSTPMRTALMIARRSGRRRVRGAGRGEPARCAGSDLALLWAGPVIFLTYWFAIFGAAALALFWVARPPQLRLLLLVLSSAVFHTHFAGPAGVLPILALGTATYLLGLTRSRRLCRLGIVACALGLVFYKYTVFVSSEVLALASTGLG